MPEAPRAYTEAWPGPRPVARAAARGPGRQAIRYAPSRFTHPLLSELGTRVRWYLRSPMSLAPPRTVAPRLFARTWPPPEVGPSGCSVNLAHGPTPWGGGEVGWEIPRPWVNTIWYMPRAYLSFLQSGSFLISKISIPWGEEMVYTPLRKYRSLGVAQAAPSFIAQPLPGHPLL